MCCWFCLVGVRRMLRQVDFIVLRCALECFSVLRCAVSWCGVLQCGAVWSCVVGGWKVMRQV